MRKVTLYHNPRCSKSRAALALLESQDVDLTIVLYLETPPDQATLASLVTKLGVEPRQLLRQGEAEYTELDLGRNDIDASAIFSAIAAHPRLLERPIAVCGDRAVIGRPPERINELL